MDAGSIWWVGRGVPALAVAGVLDELADGDEGGGDVVAEDDDGVAVRHPPELAVAVHPGVVRSMGHRWVAWMRVGMPVRAIWAAAAMSFWWLVRHTG